MGVFQNIKNKLISFLPENFLSEKNNDSTPNVLRYSGVPNKNIDENVEIKRDPFSEIFRYNSGRSLFTYFHTTYALPFIAAITAFIFGICVIVNYKAQLIDQVHRTGIVLNELQNQIKKNHEDRLRIRQLEQMEHLLISKKLEMKVKLLDCERTQAQSVSDSLVLREKMMRAKRDLAQCLKQESDSLPKLLLKEKKES